MRQEPSYTAATMALQRAFESDRPSGSRLFCDPYAEAFTSGPLRFLARASRLPLVGPLAPRLFDLIGGPGPRPSAVARTRLIDDIASEGAPTVSQVVILGAGFDTRAHRLPALAGVPVFEVDHPATQAAKRSVVESLGLSSAMVTYVAVDFERQSLEQQLRAAGLRTGMSTLFIWEGVTNYLSDSAVDETLLSIGRLAGPGGVLVFTYVDAGVLDGSVSFSEARRWLANVRRAGEPWTFGLVPSNVGGFLGDRGFVLVSDVSTKQAGERWFAAMGRHEHGSALYHVAVARTA
jgi:methyltransferase (TIGR00027 family)